MNQKLKNIILPAATLVAGLGIASGVAVHAASTSGNGTNPVSNLVQAIAQKFNLNQADVQQVFDQQHAQMEAQHQQQFADRLQQAVTDGKLTQDQADKIKAKAQELQTQREANKTQFESMTPQQRQDAFKTEQDNLQQWEKDNNIPAGYLPFGPGGHGRGMGMMGRGHGGPDFDGDGPDGRNDDDGGQPSAAQQSSAQSSINATTNQ